jgi:hypothetical protein
MSEPQKVATCRYCSQDITWHKDPVSGKNYPKNLNGSPHLCKKNNAPAPVTDIAGDAVEKAQAKMAAAGFGQPVQQGEKKPDCTSTPNTPAGAGLNPDVRSSPKTLKGTVSSINTAKSVLIVEDTDGITHGFSYPAELDVLVNKQKPGWFVEVTYRTQGDRELLTDVKYAERPAGQKRGGPGNWAPKKPRVTISATVNLQNYENIKVEVEGATADECTKILIDTLNGFAKNPAYVSTRDMIQSYMARVLNTGGA